MKTLCLYVTHEFSHNLDFFIKHGIHTDPDIDYYIILNNPMMKLVVPGATVVNRENKNLDFGAWSHLLLRLEDDGSLKYEKYDYFVLLNSTIRGPFLPVWQTDKNWLRLFTNRLSDEVKLVGSTIAWGENQPHVQSMLLVLDKVGMALAIKNEIFELTSNYSHDEIIIKKEIGLSSLIINNGYNISSLLTALNGIDFRKEEFRSHSHIFFWKSWYFGIDVHPYESIFIKETNLLGPCESSPFMDAMTLWSDSPTSLMWDKFDWRSYVLNYDDLWNANIRTEEAAQKHYSQYGINEGRLTQSYLSSGYFYNIDLNVYGYHGLFNQINCLVNAIIIGHYTGRCISVDKFYPDYNSRIACPVGKMIDLSRLNLLIASLGLKTKIGTNGQRYNVKHSKYMNWAIKGNYLEILYTLKKEEGHALDLGNTFSFMFQKCDDHKLRNLYDELFNGISFVKELECISEDIIKDLELKEYSGVHLRLEDDMLSALKIWEPNNRQSGSDLYQKYLRSMETLFNRDKMIFIATGLGKTEHKYNFVLDELRKKFPNIVLSLDWRKNYPDLIKGREIDAIIDYLICKNADAFIGYSVSTFSEAIILNCVRRGTKFIDCTVDTISKIYNVTTHKVSHGSLGLDFKLGYSTKYNDRTTNKVEIDDKDVITISAHAPSFVKVIFNNPMTIRGYCSPTAVLPPLMTFICDDKKIGTVNRPGEQTDFIEISPGEHTLIIKTSESAWAHSIWLIKEL